MKIGEWCHVKRLGIIKTEQACVNCHQCDRVCTMSLPVAQLVNHTPVGSMLADRECIQCGECVKKCPKKAIKWGKGKIGASVIVMGLILCTHPLQAEENETKEKQSVQSEQNIDRDYFDQLLLSQMKTSHAKAISFVLFTQDQIVMEQGYGTTDKGINVTEHTPMSIGSVTKVWTWAMLHRLINEGDLAINDKVVTYLPELNKVTHGDQITVEQLMTHTSGFEDNLSKLFTQVKNPKASLMKEEREVLFEPGTMIGYSNYGAALGGEIIERISSSTFEQCITEQFIKPLGLQDTSINHKLTRYYAAGAINASAQDMGKFGQMLLTQQEMEPMFEHGFSMVEDMPGMTYGMMEWERNGVRGVWHSGGTPTTYSMLFLIPEYQIGFFVAYERPDSTEERSQLRQAFLDYYFPVAAEVAIDTRKDVPSDEDLEGYYREARTSKRFPENLIFILARTEYLKQYPNGEIDFRGHTFRPIAPHHYIEVQGQQRLEIVWKDINGTGQLSPVIVQDEEPHEVYYPSGVYDTPPFVIGVAITVIVGVCVGGVILGLKLKRYLKKSKIN